MSEEGSTKLSKIAKCPICSGELEKGYVIIWKTMWWGIKKHDFRSGEERLTQYPAFTKHESSCTKMHKMPSNNSGILMGICKQSKKEQRP